MKAPVSRSGPGGRPPKRRPGRPSRFDQAVADQICERLAAGESLRCICRNPAMPCRTAVGDWLARHETFRTAVARARDRAIEDLTRRLLQLADGGHDAQTKQRIGVTKWLIKNLAPRKWRGNGERAEDDALDRLIAILGERR